ncbi:MAG: ClbS/DfsB family four-helix bundle protein [Anaerolineales bacterium]|nr:ClbS/DfsB family four-helix bundle protein [Anaerolineales bacterium]
MTKEQLLAKVRDSRAAFSQLLAQWEPARMDEAVTPEGWTVRDIVAHISAWERKLCEWLPLAAAGTKPSDLPGTDEEIDAMNAGFFAANRDRDTADVLAEFAENGEKVMAVVTAVPESTLTDPNHLPWREGRPLWYMVGGNTFWHYEEHEAPIEAWLAS